MKKKSPDKSSSKEAGYSQYDLIEVWIESDRQIDATEITLLEMTGWY